MRVNGQVMMVKCKKNGKIYAMKTIKKAHVVKNNKVEYQAGSCSL